MMENVCLLLFYFMYQRMRCSIRRRAINRRSRRMFLILHRIKQNLLFLQSIQTATLTLLVAAARVVHPRLERGYWALLRPRLGYSSSSCFKTIVSPVIGIILTKLWGGYFHPTGTWKVITNIGMIWKCRLISVIQCWIRCSRYCDRFRIDPSKVITAMTQGVQNYWGERAAMPIYPF